MKTWALMVLLALTSATARAQAGRDPLAAGTERYLLADYERALPLLSLGLNPAARARDLIWSRGVERLADVLLVLRQDALAATWLRWAARLSPEFAVDEERAPPAVVRAARAARAFVDSTPQDPFVVRTEFHWPAAFRPAAPGIVRLDAANIPITARIGADQFMRGGESRSLPPGSYDAVVSAPGYLPTRLTVELLPGVETRLRVSLLPETAGVLYVAARPWATLLVDSQVVGYTGVAGHRLSPGNHTLRLMRDSGPILDTTIVVGERQQIRFSWIARRDTTFEPGLDSALSALDAAEFERGAEALRSQVGSGGAVALARLAEATWALRARDSARAYLRRMVEVDPFYKPPADLFNPDLRATYERIRQETPVIGIRAPRDTVLVPARDTLPVEIAVGRPGDVRFYLRLPSPRTRDTLLAAFFVESFAVVHLLLALPDGNVLPAGSFELEAEVVFPGGGARRGLTLNLERMSVDTAAHMPPTPPSDFLPEVKKGPATWRTVLHALGLGTAALMIPVIINDKDLSGRSVPLAAGLVGVSIAVADFSLNRPSVAVPENVHYNATVRAQWEERNRSIAARNALTLQHTPVRVRTGRNQ